MEKKAQEELTYNLFQKGLHFLETGHPAQAAFLLEKVKKTEPRKGSVREALGRAYYKWQQFERAKAEFESAIEIDPLNHYAHFGLGLCFEKLKKKNMALRHLKLALAMAPHSLDYQRALRRITKRKILLLGEE